MLTELAVNGPTAPKINIEIKKTKEFEIQELKQQYNYARKKFGLKKGKKRRRLAPVRPKAKRRHGKVGAKKREEVITSLLGEIDLKNRPSNKPATRVFSVSFNSDEDANYAIAEPEIELQLSEENEEGYTSQPEEVKPMRMFNNFGKRKMNVKAWEPPEFQPIEESPMRADPPLVEEPPPVERMESYLDDDIFIRPRPRGLKGKHLQNDLLTESSEVPDAVLMAF